MKGQKKSGKVAANELLDQIKRLQNELFMADVQYELYVGLRKAGPIYKEEFRCSPLFWDYTVDSHIAMVVLRLCRIYDTDKKTFSLPRFLNTVEENSHLFSMEAFVKRNKDNPNLNWLAKYPRDLNLDGLKKAQAQCSPKNPIVRNLLVMRHHFIAHTNHELAFGGTEAFQQKYPLPFRDIKKLIEDGFTVVNTYSSLFGASHFSGVEGTNYPVHDYQFILDALKERLKRFESH